MDPYPDVKNILASNIISHNYYFYTFGGIFNDSLVTNEILRFKNEIWSKVGNLLSKREQFSIALFFNKVHVIGGKKKQENEVCKLSDTVNCEQDFIIDFKNFKQPVLLSVNLDDSCAENNMKTISKYEPSEIKDLIILTNETFKEIENFVQVYKTNNTIYCIIVILPLPTLT